jgi:hypothetical protein
MPVVKPIDDRLIPGIGFYSISINGMFRSFNDGLANEIGRFEIHIGYPEWNYIGFAKILLSQIVFYTGCIFPVNYQVKIIFHAGILFVNGKTTIQKKPIEASTPNQLVLKKSEEANGILKQK